MWSEACSFCSMFCMVLAAALDGAMGVPAMAGEAAAGRGAAAWTACTTVAVGEAVQWRSFAWQAKDSKSEKGLHIVQVSSAWM